MEHDFVIIQVERRWYNPFQKYITLKCLRDCKAIEQTLVGERYIIGVKDYTYTVRMPKSIYIEPGGLVNLNWLLPQAINQNAIGWYWSHEQ